MELKDNEIANLHGQLQQATTRRDSMTVIKQIPISLGSSDTDPPLELPQMGALHTMRRCQLNCCLKSGCQLLSGWQHGTTGRNQKSNLLDKARQKWVLLEATDKLSYDKVTAALKSKLDPSRKALIVQDFCHLSQGRN